MTISAQIIADSISPAGIRLTTFQLRYPRFIHAELMTHRVFSRNASSSRAIPVKKMIEDLRRDPAMPVYWGSNKPGMQAGKEVESIHNVTTDWLEAMENAIYKAQKLMASGLHKQIANRILEPWAHINVVVTATSWANFFALRSHPDAQPEIKMLSDLMQERMAESIPIELQPGEWHLPYVNSQTISEVQHYVWNKDRETKGLSVTDTSVISTVSVGMSEILPLLKQISVARCARVSYLTHDGRRTTVEEDMALAHKLVVATPLHASPAEHQATPDMPIIIEEEQHLDEEGSTKYLGVRDAWEKPHLHGNLTGWIQYRKTLPNEFVEG